MIAPVLRHAQFERAYLILAIVQWPGILIFLHEPIWLQGAFPFDTERVMPILDTLIGPLTSIIDKIIPDKAARERAKIELAKLQGTQEMELLQARLSAIVAEANSADPWTSRARPSFLYVMYAIILWAVPMGLIGAVSPATAGAIAGIMSAYLNGLPEPLYALFGTGYLGYTVVRQWGKNAGTDK